MPATDFGWSVGGQPTVCQMFGNKRKNDGQDIGEDHMSGVASKRQCTEAQLLASQNGAVQQMETAALPQHVQYQNSHSPHLSQISHQPAWGSHLTHIPREAGDHTSVFNNNNNSHLQQNNNLVMDREHSGEENNNQISATQSFSQTTLAKQILWANSADPDQTAPSGAVFSGSSLFAKGVYVRLYEDDMIMDLTDEVYSTACVNLDPTNVTTDAEYEAACSMMAAMEGEGAPDPQQYQLTNHDQLAGGDYARPLPGTVQCLSKPSLWNDMQPYVSDYY